MNREIRQQLEELAEDKYQEFVSKLIPGETLILGVRIPALRQMARKIAKEEWRFYLEKKESKPLYMEEIMLQGMVIGYARMSLEERFFYLEQWIPEISNWSVCDSCCMTYHFMKQDQDKWWEFLCPYLYSGKEFFVRFALVALLNYFVKDNYINVILKELKQIKQEGYYAKMAAAWAISVCFIKYPEKVSLFLKQDLSDEFIRKKAVQKICESYRVTSEQKEQLRKQYIKVIK